MNSEAHDILLIEDYLDGKLTGKALADFQKRVNQDDRFSALLETRRKLAAASIEAQEYQQLKREIGMVMQAEKKRVFGLKPAWTWSIAASVIILIGLVIVLRYTGTRSNQMSIADSTEFLRMDEPQKYALKDSVAILIIAPVMNKSYPVDDSLFLRWESKQERDGELFITNAVNGQVLIQKLIDVREGEYVIQPDMLPAGKYNWYIDDTVTKGSFVIEGK